MKIAALFFDLDQTLYDGNSNSVPESAVLAIKKAQENGVKAFVCTGRSFSGVKKINLADIKWDGYVCSNGANYYDSMGNSLKSVGLSKQQLEAMFDLCQKYQIGLALQNTETMYQVLSYNNYCEKAFKFFGLNAPEKGVYHNEEINMCTIYQEDDFNYDICNEIDGLLTIKGKANYADVIIKGINKGFGVKTAKELFNIEGLTMGFGDADNDLELIQDADIGVAMGNSTELIKKNADYVTSSILDNGIYNTLKHFEII